MAEDFDAEFALFENEISALEAAGEVTITRRQATLPRARPPATYAVTHAHVRRKKEAIRERARLEHAVAALLQRSFEPEKPRDRGEGQMLVDRLEDA